MSTTETRPAVVARRHILSFPNREKYNGDGDGAEYALDGRTIGFAEEGLRSLLRALDTFDAGDTLVNTFALRGVNIDPRLPPVYHDPFWRDRDELLAKVRRKRIYYEYIDEVAGVSTYPMTRYSNGCPLRRSPPGPSPRHPANPLVHRNQRIASPFAAGRRESPIRVQKSVIRVQKLVIRAHRSLIRVHESVISE